MKKVFAFMSTLLLALACFGLFAQPVEAAAEKWTVDPTLAEDEIPMYEMGSIYTTFPNYYDNAAKADELWGGSSRMYPWNETRLRVAQYDASGVATGKYYAIFFSGSTSAVNADGVPTSGAGNNVNVYTKKADGSYTIGRVATKSTGNTITEDATPMDPSLSHMRVNITKEDISINMINVSNAIGDGSNNQNLYNRMFVFDGEGRIIRGVAMDGFYVKPGSDGAAEDLWAPQFCYVDGVVVPYVEGETTCDKVKVAQVDENGDPVTDEEGNPVMVETDEANFLYKRFMWEWFEEAPTNVNTVGYQAAGWDCDLWDYVVPAADGNGHIAIAFLNGEGTNHKINDTERAVTNASRDAEHQLPAGDYYRACVAEIRIPADGGTFDFGYLDKGVATEAAKFNNIVRGAFLNGRTVNSAVVKTYNFSTSGLKTLDIVKNGYSYQLMAGKNVVEVAKGQTFTPTANMVYEGLASAWGTQDDVTSYTKNLEALEYSMYVNGTMVVYKYPYADKAEMVADFLKDLTVFMEDVREDATYGYSEGKKAVTLDDLYPTGALNWELISTSKNDSCFWGPAANRTKWAWMVNYVAEVRRTSGLSTAYWETIDQGLTASPGTFNCEITMFLRGEHRTSWPASSDYTVDANANGFLPTQTNLQSFLSYTIDTSADHADKTYDVVFEVKNATTGISDSYTIRYIVADGYTPIINVNKDALYIYPREVDGKIVVDPIDPQVFVTAYNAKYNGKSILGDEITQNVHFSSETLDFAAPKEGKHVVKAVVYNDAKHFAEIKFVVAITDMTAPYVDFYDKLYLPYGTAWTPELAVKKAVDSVDGDLTKVTFEWCVDMSSNPVNTTKAGKYTAKVEVYDEAGNSVASKNIQVNVLPQAATTDEITAVLDEKFNALNETISLISADVADVADAVAEVKAAVAEVKTAVAALPDDADIAGVNGKVDTKVAEILAKIAEIKTAVDSVQTTANDVNTAVTSKGCKKSAYFFEFLAAGCLLVFLLRKKH